MMGDAEVVDELLQWLIDSVGDGERADIPEQTVVAYCGAACANQANGIEIWQRISGDLRRPVLRDGFVIQWNFFRNVVRVIRLPSPEELLSSAEHYQRATPQEIERKIRSLTGQQFERFMGAVLIQSPEFRNIVVTSGGPDGGVDIRGHYVPSRTGHIFSLIGQAKQVGEPITAPAARDFIGAIDTAGTHHPFGLFVSTSGFTQPAASALEKSRYPIVKWGMAEIVANAEPITTRQVDISFAVPDETFWGEISG
jgi:hypothetical protein